MNVSHPYQGLDAALATKHEKGSIIAPEFLRVLGMNVIEIEVDTDELGTFSGEVERIGTPREVAIRKAKLGISKSGQPRGLASEGSIGADFYIPFINFDIETLAFVDEEFGFEIVETYRSLDITAQKIEIFSASELEDFLEKADFPNHKLIVRNENKPITFSRKGISNYEELNRAIQNGLKLHPKIIIENDFRAHCSPSRQENIKKAAEKLALRLLNLCTECKTPGWGVVDYKRGLPCQMCGLESKEAAHSEILGCTKCNFRKNGKVLAEKIDPSKCNFCNP